MATGAAAAGHDRRACAGHRPAAFGPATALTFLLLTLATRASAAAPTGPTYESLQQQPAVTRFLWWGHVAAPATADTPPEAFLFVATDSSWLLVEHGGEIAGVGPESWYDTPPPLADPPAPIDAAEFERATARERDHYESLCNRYDVLRASLEKYWQARPIWRGRVSMQEHMFVELFSAADGRWGIVVHSPRLESPAEQACMPQRGFYSRLFEQPENASQTD